jgi:SAM-dependent methyltransferase
MTSTVDETAAEALARLYDVDLLDDPGDLDLWLALAGRGEGPVLELAVGTGRVAVRLAAAGHDVTGIDIDPAMLARARAAAARDGADVESRLRLVQADLLEVDDADIGDGGSFGLAFIALNSLFLLADRDAQREAIAVMARRLRPGAIAAVDVWLPDAEDLAGFDGRLGLEYERVDPETGRRVVKMASARHDPTSDTVELTVIYDEGEDGRPPNRWVRRDRLRLVGPDQLRDDARAAGLTVELIAGDHDLTPIGPGSERAILIATRR